MSDKSIHELRAHILHLAAAFKLRVLEGAVSSYDDSAMVIIQEKGTANFEYLIFLPYVDSEEAYAVALHEMGHKLHPAGSMREMTDPDNELLKREEEVNAWAWARRQALVWTPTMEDVMQRGLASYQHERQQQQSPQPYKAGESIADFMRRTRE